MRTSILTVATVATLATPVDAQEALPRYQYEAMGRLSWTTTDTSPDVEITELDLAGTYYFQPVEVGAHPWNEAAFLEHSKALRAELGYTKFEVSSFDADGPSFGAGFLYADKERPFAAEFDFSFGKLNGDQGIDIDQVDVAGKIGYWLRPNAIVGGQIIYDNLDANGLLEIEQIHVGGFGKIVHDLGDGRAINGEAAIGVRSVDAAGSSDTNFELGVSGDYYFEPRYSVGALLQLSFGNAASDEGVTIGVRGAAWLCPSAAVEASYARFSASDNAGSDQDEFAVWVKVRF